ncbi:MAG TPA: topoisomerase C-terminal repeat-containing protein, partial [Roseiarcus sp.]|nr:topoisomerase C-terminal repeat-containing protein [Roseiarcus sp.]
RDFWKDFSAAIGGTKELRTAQILDSLNELLGPHIFPPRADGADPRLCPNCNKGQLSLKLGKYGAFIGCSNYPECRYTRTLAQSANGEAQADGERAGVRVLGEDPQTGEEISVREGRFGAYLQQGEGDKPKRSSLPKDLAPADVTLAQAIALLSLPREVARHPTTGEPILAGLGRYGAYVQHGKTYANLGKDDHILEIGANRAIDLIVAKESGVGGRRFGPSPGRVLGEHPTLKGPVAVKEGRYGAYVNHGKVNATLPQGVDPATISLDSAVALLADKASGRAGGGRPLGEHPSGGPVTVRAGRFGAYVNWGRVNATIPKSLSPDAVTLGEALDLIAEKGGRPAAKGKAKPPATSAAKAKAKPGRAPQKAAKPAAKTAEKARRKA